VKVDFFKINSTASTKVIVMMFVDDVGVLTLRIFLFLKAKHHNQSEAL
jgi:hypothetical protein